jgi:hypothetical protein
MPTKSIIRNVGACIAAIAASAVLFVLVELFSAVVHPTPAGFAGTMEEMCVHVANYPNWVLAVVLPMWAFIAFAGTWIAGRVGGIVSAIAISLLLITAMVWNIAMLPYPSWFKIVQPIAILVAVLFSFRMSIVSKNTPAI